MHISIIANGFQEDYITNLLNNLINKVEKIDLIGSSIHADRKLSSKINFYNFRGRHFDKETIFQKYLRITKYFYKLVRYLNKSEAKIIHFQWIRFHIIEGIILMIYIKLIGKIVIYTAHDILPRSRDNAYHRFLFKIIYKYQDTIIVHTSHLKSRLITEFNIHPKKVYVIKHGTYDRNDNNISLIEARKYLGIPLDATIILFFGFIAEYKGLDILLKSVKDMEKKLKVHILIAGRVKIEYKKQFLQLLSDYSSLNLVLKLGYINDSDIEYFFKACNVTVLPYKEDSQSGVLFMSYAYGLPVIAPKLGSFPEDIVYGKTGYLFNLNSSNSLQNALIQCHNEMPPEDFSRKLFIKEYAKANYSWNESCNQLVAIYKSLI